VAAALESSLERAYQLSLAALDSGPPTPGWPPDPNPGGPAPGLPQGLSGVPQGPRDAAPRLAVSGPQTVWAPPLPSAARAAPNPSPNPVAVPPPAGLAAAGPDPADLSNHADQSGAARPPRDLTADPWPDPPAAPPGARIDAQIDAAPPPSPVQNTFNVSVSIAQGEGLGADEREGLEEALVEILRQAARRHGLEG
jgi:hypothetical protein